MQNTGAEPMSSPFPGMDPYLEPHWLDVHTKLVAYAADALNESLPAELIARTEERIAIESGDTSSVRAAPDVRIFTTRASDIDAVAAGGVALAPHKLVAMTEPVTERFIEIIDQGGRLISVIEFVSPTNKMGHGLTTFRERRDNLLAGGVAVVEIDLVRKGDWEGLLLPHRCPAELRSTYRVTTRIPSEPNAVYLQPINLRASLPPAKIPLRPIEPPAVLELQPLLERAYRNGRYARTLDYRNELTPPLPADDAPWIDAILRRAGRR